MIIFLKDDSPVCLFLCLVKFMLYILPCCCKVKHLLWILIDTFEVEIDDVLCILSGRFQLHTVLGLQDITKESFALCAGSP